MIYLFNYALLVIFHGLLCDGFWFFNENKFRSVCYEAFGCFNTSYPYNNSETYVPNSPEFLDVGFHVFHQGNVSIRVHWDIRAIHLIDLIDPDLPTTILIHGFQDHGRTDWTIKMTNEFFKSEAAMNILTLDWAKGSSPIIYTQAVANTRLVGKIGAEFVKTLVYIGVRPADLHLIGHSLGAHVAGYIGSELKGNIDIFRITGLDPAAPFFEGHHPLVRLDETDAIFVDVVHSYTDPIINLGKRVGIGMLQRAGTVDFYPNGGRYQPGCALTIYDKIHALFFSGGTPDWKTLKSSFGCSHLRAIDLYRESINSDCKYRTLFCWSVDDVLPWGCSSCDNTQCPMFGYKSVNYGFAGIFYIKTNSASPFCSA